MGSGKGKISVYKQSPTNLTALLYNFDINSSTVKREHLVWLKETALQYVTRRNARAFLSGFASRSGGDQYNLQLSHRRASAISDQLFLLHPDRLSDEILTYFGERAAALLGVKDGTEDDKWRGVMIQVYDTTVPPPPPAPPKLVKRRVSVTCLLDEGLSGIIPKDAGDKGYRFGKALAQSTIKSQDIAGSPIEADIDATFEVVKVTIRESTVNSGIPAVAQYSQRYLEVSYDWGPSFRRGARTQLIFVDGIRGHGHGQNKTMNDQ